MPRVKNKSGLHIWKSEFSEDVKYKIVFYGKMVKGKQDSAAMDHPVVKGKQMA